MRHYRLVTIDRRGGTCFNLKSLTGVIIGAMVLNPGKARHELELSESDFLKHSKALAALCKIPGAAVYVESVRDDDPPKERAPEVIEFEAGYNLAMDGRELPDEASQAVRAGWEIVKAKPPTMTIIEHGPLDTASKTEWNPATVPTTARLMADVEAVTAKTPFFSLKKIAKAEGVSIDGLKGAVAVAAVINAARSTKLAGALA